MSSMRRTIARRLTEAKTTIPHFYVRRRVRADRLLALRTAVQGQRPSVNDYLVRACALRSEERRVGTACVSSVALGGRRIIEKKNVKRLIHLPRNYII